MTLNEVKEGIEIIDYNEETTCSFYLDGIPLGHPIDFHSWRGSYNYLGIELKENSEISPDEFISAINCFEPGVYTGWKGGDNQLDFDTTFFIDNGVGTVGNCVTAIIIVFEDNKIKIICEENMF
jgi:hypothetical protein